MPTTTNHAPTIACTIIALLLASCIDSEKSSEHHGDSEVAHWGYETDNGPDAWASMDPEWSVCAEGREQSPIDISSATETELPAIIINRPSEREFEVLNQAGVVDALDNGHTIQVNSMTGETIAVGDGIFALVQFHFHAPSEHTVDGKHFPMEMHFVHQADNGSLAVVGVLIEEGAANAGIAPLWAQLAASPGTNATIDISAEFSEQLFPDIGTGLHHYEGSLTTPPCSEGVKWYVRKTPTQLSREQIAAFTAVYNHNNRPVQALNGRTLYLDENPNLSIRN